MRGAFHVAFIADSDLIQGAVRAMGDLARDDDVEAVGALLGEARVRRQRRREQRTVQLEAAERQTIESLLGAQSELAAALGSSPAVVREAMLTDLRLLAGRLASLRNLPAPQVVLDGLHRRVAAVVVALDPSRPLAPEEPEEVGRVEKAPGVSVPNLHDWLDALLRACRDPSRPLVGLGPEVGAVDLDGSADDPGSSVGWPGIEFTSLGLSPDPRVWMPPRIALPRPLHAGGLVAVGVSGGWATWALAGDAVRPELSDRMTASVRGLAPGEALVSFVCLEDGVDWPWTDPPS